jgi:hypothetical protein
MTSVKSSPRKGEAYIFYVGLIAQADGTIKANPTLAAGDVTISKDGGNFANLATLPDAEPNAGKAVRVQLSATEMNADNIVIIFADVAGAEWYDAFFNLQTI